MGNARNDEEKPKEKPPLTEAQRAKKAIEQEKMDHLREINRKFYWKAQQDRVEFELKRNGELIKVNENPQGALAMIGMGNTALPNPLEIKEEGVYELTTKYTNDQGKKFTTKVVMNIDKDHNITLPGRAYGKNRYGMKHNWSSDWGAVFQAYSVGLGVHEVDLTFPKAESPKDVNLQTAWEIVKQANAAGVAVYIDSDPNLMMRLNNPQSKAEIRLCEKIRHEAAESQKKVAANKEWSAEIQEAGKGAYVSGLAKRGDTLEEAVKALVAATERDPAKVKAIENAMVHISAALNAMKSDLARSQPSTTISQDYNKSTEKMAATLTRLEAELAKPALQASADDLKKLRDSMNKLGVQFTEISGKAGINAKPAEARANDKANELKATIQDVEQKLQILKTGEPADQVKQMEALIASMKKAVEATREIGTEMKSADASVHLLKMAKEVDNAVRKTEAVLAEITNIHPDKADAIERMHGEIKMVSNNLQSHLDPLEAINKRMEHINNLNTPEDKKAEVMEDLNMLQREFAQLSKIVKDAKDIDKLEQVEAMLQEREKRFDAIGKLVTEIEKGPSAAKAAMQEPAKLGVDVKDDMEQLKAETQKRREHLISPSVAGIRAA